MFNWFKKKEGSKVVTRIAPSPTGVLHIGTARTALFNYLYAKQNNGKFIIRIEDTDKERSKDEYEKNIVEGLKVLGLSFDGYYKQSERTLIYQKYLNKLIKEGKAYVSKEEGGERDEVIRFKNPNKKITFNDEIRGEITFDTTELGDFVIAKSVTEPLYHLAVVVDDYEMGITHIIRGEDGISNTPRQILIQEAIGAPTPTYAHLPLILGKDKSKLSKRHGATSLTEFKEKGYMTEAIVNQLAFLGWNPGTEQEIFTLDELIKEFDLSKVQKGGAVFNEDKLQWFNHQYITKVSDEEYLEQLEKRVSGIDKDVAIRMKDTVLERVNIWDDLSEDELKMYIEVEEYDVNNLIWKNSDKESALKNLEYVKGELEKLDDYPSADEVKESIWSYAEENGKGDVLWPLRYALSGKDKSPDPFTLVYILGKDETINRVNIGISKLNG